MTSPSHKSAKERVDNLWHNDELFLWFGGPKTVPWVLLPVMNISRVSHHCKPLTHCEQDLSLHKTKFQLYWTKLCSSDNHYTTGPWHHLYYYLHSYDTKTLFLLHLWTPMSPKTCRNYLYNLCRDLFSTSSLKWNPIKANMPPKPRALNITQSFLKLPKKLLLTKQYVTVCLSVNPVLNL